MSIDYLFAVPDADIPNSLPAQTAYAADDGGTLTAYLVGELGFAAWDALPTAYIVGAWDRSQESADGYLQAGQTFGVGGVVEGTPTYPLQPDYTAYIRPLGNKDGFATGPLDSIRWQGHPEAKWLQDDRRYTDTDSPFTLEIIRQDYGSTAQPWDNGTTYNTGDFVTSGGMWQSLQDNNTGNTPFGGSAFWEFINQSGPWGWVVKMLSDDPLRDITARAIGIYTDPEATIFQYTTGAFINDGKYGDVFYTECPPGNRLADASEIYFALLLGSAQEGIFQLDALADGAEATALFWTADQ